MKKILMITVAIGFWSCAEDAAIKPDYVLSADQKHNKFSKLIPPALTVPSGSVIKVETTEASDGQLHKEAGLDDLINIDFSRIHPLTGPVYVEEAEVGGLLRPDLGRAQRRGPDLAAHGVQDAGGVHASPSAREKGGVPVEAQRP